MSSPQQEMFSESKKEGALRRLSEEKVEPPYKKQRTSTSADRQDESEEDDQRKLELAIQPENYQFQQLGKGFLHQHGDLKQLSDESEWYLWGPYLSERQWGTVREDYSSDGNCWKYFTHNEAHQRAYQWGEDGLFGVCDKEARLCCALSLWNGQDPMLKERLYGLTGLMGNHGEDVKECYYYLDNTPTHSYMKALYKYPQNEFPYLELEKETASRTVKDPEYELEDTGVFDDSKYWDVEVEYFKDTPRTILCQYTISNRGCDRATIHVLPTIWFRNTWSWGNDFVDNTEKKPYIRKVANCNKVVCNHGDLGEYSWMVYNGQNDESTQYLFTENETKLDTDDGTTTYSKDAFHQYVVQGDKNTINGDEIGTKCAAHIVLNVEPESSVVVKWCLVVSEDCKQNDTVFGDWFTEILSRRRQEADVFYQEVLPVTLTKEERSISRQAYAGLLWSKQFYFYNIRNWMKDYAKCSKSSTKTTRRNKDWCHLVNKHIISMPDKWEFPWYASWDLAFHMIPYTDVDSGFAKQQLLLMLSEGYMHPNGQVPAYEFDFSDVNPPVHAWACLYVYRKTGDRDFLAKCFHKMILNFGWWLNTKDPHGNHLFTGGFLGLDNIAPFDRSKIARKKTLLQADATGWMGFYALKMMEIALELCKHDPVYVDMAGEFLQHFLLISSSINGLNEEVQGLWHESDGLYYDNLYQDDGGITPLRLHSLVGIIPFFACCVLDADIINSVPGFQDKLKWYQTKRKDICSRVFYKEDENKIFLSIPDKRQLDSILSYLLDKDEFLSPHGIRSLSKFHKENTLSMTIEGLSDEDDQSCTTESNEMEISQTDDGTEDEQNQSEPQPTGEKKTQTQEYSIEYSPGESTSDMFGGNSNWRGPVWICMNYLIIESLQMYSDFYSDTMMVEYPRGSGNKLSLKAVAMDISRRLVTIFSPDVHGKRPCHGNSLRYSEDPNWKDLVLFYEYFHGDTGRGCGASHQTGWTALVATLIKKTKM
ncbi:uncharacterized protein LOC100374233 [Saccoglossus kowalevskii]|uniref:Uncharacterized protein YMR196W-like n=1 Tax=Saccoglossus kowalevskii TaxID=10224 RepID=A0ABM0GRP3_SACKO|nr:PREDICTED: uncharacterized protein YMR196W-like [Saccoglossus kowalevskii]